MRIEHINLTVSDVDVSSAFYQQLTGGRVRWEGVAERGQRAVHVGDDQLYLSLFEADAPGRAPADYDAMGFNHLGFEVEDLSVFRDRLAAMGVEITRDETYEPGERVYFYDPDGYEIELVAY